MNSEGERLKQLRKALKIRQGDFAKKISTTQGHISDIENGRKNLSERTIKLICLENWDGRTVNEDWLRNGTGKMFIELTRNEAITDFMADLLKEEEESYKKRLINAIIQLDESELEVISDLASVILEKKKKD